MPQPRDGRVHLVARQLAALTRLCTLRDLDLQLVRVDEIFRGDAEPRGRHLLDGAAPHIAVGIRHKAGSVLTTLTGVRTPAQPVHCDRERLVHLLAYRSMRHRARGEAADDARGE